MTDLCEACKTFKNTFNQKNRCCQVRMLMESPKHVRLPTYAQIKADEGEEAYEAIKKAVHDEYNRKMKFKTDKQTEAYRKFKNDK